MSMHITELYHDLNCYKTSSIMHYDRTGESSKPEANIPAEDLLDVYVNEKLTLKLVCTPSDLAALTLGHLYSEGMISDVNKVESIHVCEFGHRARVFLSEELSDDIFKGDPIEIRTCDCGANGVLGRNDILAGITGAEQLMDILPPYKWEKEWIFLLADAFSKDTPLHAVTHGTHSCFLFADGEIKYRCEDIGRHNALDKVIGKALIDGVDLTKSILFSSGRIPVDMILKVIRSRVPVIASNSVPTDKAAELAQRFNVTLVCSVRQNHFNVFSDGGKSEING